MAQQQITYKDMTKLFGNDNAYDLMRTIERLAQIQYEIIVPFDREQRLQRALEALGDGDSAA